MVNLSAEDLDPDENARIIKSAVSPRPIAWISTVDENGDDNLAPFSSYNYVSSNYPVVLFNSPNESAGGLKDTARNALETGEFAVNVVTEDLLEAMDHTSETLPPGKSEFDSANVRRAACETIEPPRVADAVVTMECTLHDSFEIRDRIMILGDVQHYHLADAILTNGKVDAQTFETVGRLGGPYYTVADRTEFERQF